MPLTRTIELQYKLFSMEEYIATEKSRELKSYEEIA